MEPERAQAHLPNLRISINRPAPATVVTTAGHMAPFRHFMPRYLGRGLRAQAYISPSFRLHLKQFI